jgi:hypothetical protein
LLRNPTKRKSDEIWQNFLRKAVAQKKGGGGGYFASDDNDDLFNQLNMMKVLMEATEPVAAVANNPYRC